MPAGTIEFSTHASDTADNDTDTAALSPADLVSGTNVVAVEVHQVNDTSSDVSFDLELTGTVESTGEPRFVRGDANDDGAMDISDPVTILFYLFVGGVPAPCLDAMDANDSGLVDLSDAIFFLRYLFLGGPVIPAPFPSAGLDPTEDTLPPCE
jgi:hypothetical protein